MKHYSKIFILFILLLSFNTSVLAEVRLPRLIGDNMVLQRNTELKIWGWADANEKVSVRFKNKEYKTVTSQSGTWEIMLPKQKEGGSYEMKINHIVLKNILIGEVWLCSGQSNMELPINRVMDLYRDEIEKTNNPNIRHFKVPLKYDFNTPQKDLDGGAWNIAEGKDLLNFSAVAYFFAKELYDTHQVPIGLVNSSVGGSPAEAWISEEALKEFPRHQAAAEVCKQSGYIDSVHDEENKRSSEWYNTLNSNDKGYKQTYPWSDPKADISDWKTMDLPGYLANINGSIWFRKEIDVPSSMVGKEARLRLGCIVDSDSAFVNGTFVGTVSYQYPPRNYSIPKNVLKAGKNTVVVRVVSNSGRGGFVEDKPFKIIASGEEISLSGQWKYKIGHIMPPSPSQTFFQYKPTGLYNAMIFPLKNYKIAGVIWYQGESNTGNPSEYLSLMTSLINNWRTDWNSPQLPFVYVQLANFMNAYTYPTNSNWAELREAQRNISKIPHTAMTTIIDIGEWNDIHPLNKKEVGRRLALQARKMVYGENNLVSAGPIYKNAEMEGDKMILSFDLSGSKFSEIEQIKGFDIASSDGTFANAKAQIKDGRIVVWNDDIKNPKTVRYAWADNPQDANLTNEEGLPTSPFTTE